MAYLKCRVIATTTINKNPFWRLLDENTRQEYIIPTHKMPEDVSLGKIYNFHLKYVANNKPYIEFIEKYDTIVYKANAEYVFDVKGIVHFVDRNKEDKSKIIFSDTEGKENSVFAFFWQTPDFLKNKRTVKVKFKGFDQNRNPTFYNLDFEHPIFNEGEIYSFTIEGLKVTTNKLSQENMNILEVRGQDNILYSVLAIRGQERKINLQDEIKCLVVKIDKTIRLKQVFIEDPYFVKIEDVISNKSLINKHLKDLLAGNGTLTFEVKFYEQYSSKRSFWVFTLCNHILPKLYAESSERHDYKVANEINDMLLCVEQWILKKGIISSIPNKERAEKTLLKVQEQIKISSTKKKVLTLLLRRDYFDLLDRIDENNEISTLEEVYHLISLIDFGLIDEISYCNKILELLPLATMDEFDRETLVFLADEISTGKSIFFNNKLENTFELIENGNLRFKSFEYKQKFFNWSYCEYEIYVKLELVEKSNLTLASILRQYFYIENDVLIKQQYLFQSYYILNNYDHSCQTNPFIFNNGLQLKLDISINPNAKLLEDNLPSWEHIESSFTSGQILTVNVGKKLLSGYEVQYGNIKGFLPKDRIVDQALRDSIIEEVDFKINCVCVLFNKEFCFFIVNQLGYDHPEFLSRNNSPFSSKGLSIRTGIILQINDFGLFLESSIGRVFISKYDISEHIWDADRLKKHFDYRDEIFFVPLIPQDDRVRGSLKLLYDTDYRSKYSEFCERVDTDYLDLYEEVENSALKPVVNKIIDLIQVERAYCFEQFAITQFDLSQKISNLTMAIELFDSAKSLRTDYANIYTSYFETLLALEKAIKSYNLENLQAVNEQVKLTIDRITDTALISFPDFEKLLYFLNIILLFNNKSEDSLDNLYKYVKRYSREQKNDNLSTIAKITLSNNLMISAGEDVTDFSKKNLRLIFSYIRNGILSLKESEEDRLAREINSKISYWRGRIESEESPVLEFKSSFKTPRLDTRRKEEIVKLKSLPRQTEDVKKKIDKIGGDLAVKSIIHSSLKTLCGFANTNGGVLLIGVTDDRKICGIESDYKSLKQKDRDGFGKYFDECIKSYFDESFSALLSNETIPFPEGDVFVVEVKPSFEEVFLLKDDEGKHSEELYIRNTTSTEQLRGKQLAKYIRHKMHLKVKV